MKNLLYITSRIPTPDQRGDQIRAFHQLRNLSQSLKITLVCLTAEKNPEELVAPLEELGIKVLLFHLPKWKQYLALRHSLFTKTPFQVSYFYNKRIDREIETALQGQFFDVVHCHLIRTALYLRSHKSLRSIDFMDAYGFGMNLRYSISRNFFKKIILRSERNRLLHFETKRFDDFDRHFAISKQDALRIAHPENNKIIVSANGVDFDQFYPKKVEPTYDLVFMGNMDYVPNVAAVTFIVDEILPRIRKTLPDVTFLIAGRDATKLIQSYQSKGIDVIQHFDDISDAIASAKIMLAPMMISIGLQNKLLQSMAMKIPCITSAAANKAIGAIPNEQIITAETADEFAQETIKLLQDEDLQQSISESAYSFVHTNFTWEHCSQQILSHIS